MNVRESDKKKDRDREGEVDMQIGRCDVRKNEQEKKGEIIKD